VHRHVAVAHRHQVRAVAVRGWRSVRIPAAA
jgi:hypothetical protein